MQFFFLLLFNVFLGAVLYLVISLKLERSATEYRERRFRREMDAVIREFNLTAERNISILESKIRIMRRLLEKTGDIKSVDLMMMEEEASIASHSDERDGGFAGEPPPPAVAEGRRGDVDVRVERVGAIAAGLAKKGLLILFDKLHDIFSRREMGPIRPPAVSDASFALSPEPTGTAALMEAPESMPPFDEEDRPALIEKDLSDIVPAGTPEMSREATKSLTESEIEDIVARSDDRYAMVAVLFEGGCGIDDISRYSGIPAGEVRLVLNLSGHIRGEG